MKKIILFLVVAFLCSCTSRSEENTQTDPSDEGGNPNDSKIIPIIGATGQSNTLFSRRTYSPFTDSNINVPIVFASSESAFPVSKVDNTITAYDRVDDCMKSGEYVGNIWDFSNELWNSNWRSEHGKARFGLFSSAAGSNISFGWNPEHSINYRYQEFVLALDQAIEHTKTLFPDYTPKLHTVIINQGEANTYGLNTLVPWSNDWMLFIKKIREDYGNDVVFIIQTLNDQELFSRQCGDAKVQKSCENYPLIRAEQLSLATGSGSINEQENVYIIDGNLLGNSSNRDTHTRDAVHYSLSGISLMGKETYKVFKELNEIK